MALQLAQALRTKGIGTFVDVLDIAPAATVQGRILEALDELACLVLLESPDAIQSTWVAKEVVYAERQRLGTLSLCWAPAAAPGGAPTRFGQFDEGNRIDVSQNLVRTPFGEQLEDDYVAEVIAAIVREMTQALYYRRAQLERELLAVIPDAVRQGPWQFTVGEGSTTRLVGLAPYRPGAVDLHHLSKARVASQSASAFLVHHPIEPGTEAAEVLLWLGTGRDDFAVDTDGLAGIADGTS
ncbi:MAG TPA: toll/interleukin-1 receptor domain-containing protein [Acidimicrobiales bacterium]|nr:toll/interleukin-1 receptor domain-containing protein [Acidimicrobiales bacterium]